MIRVMSQNHFAREHYEAIATVMQSAHNHNWQAICEKLAEMLKADNPGFRRERFLKACQPVVGNVKSPHRAKVKAERNTESWRYLVCKLGLRSDEY
jgi:hypothetical protein